MRRLAWVVAFLSVGAFGAGHTPLAFAEYLLIGVASSLFPDDLLNEEGVNLGPRRALSATSK